jgi:hypothetical protein
MKPLLLWLQRVQKTYAKRSKLARLLNAYAGDNARHHALMHRMVRLNVYNITMARKAKCYDYKPLMALSSWHRHKYNFGVNIRDIHAHVLKIMYPPQSCYNVQSLCHKWAKHYMVTSKQYSTTVLYLMLHITLTLGVLVHFWTLTHAQPCSPLPRSYNMKK